VEAEDEGCKDEPSTALMSLRSLSSAQREIVVTRILREDPDLDRVMLELMATVERARFVRRLGPLRRTRRKACGGVSGAGKRVPPWASVWQCSSKAAND